jgi:hypothetical protein
VQILAHSELAACNHLTSEIPAEPKCGGLETGLVMK